MGVPFNHLLELLNDRMEVFWVLVDMLDSAGKPVVVDAMVLGKPLPGAFCFVNEAKQKDELQGL